MANIIANIDKIPAKIKLREVPIIADVLLALKPPTRYIVIIVLNIPTNIAAIIGQNPVKTIGTKTVNIKPTVASIETKLKTPFYLPIAIKRAQNSPAKNIRELSLFISAI